MNRPSPRIMPTVGKWFSKRCTWARFIRNGGRGSAPARVQPRFLKREENPPQAEARPPMRLVSKLSRDVSLFVHFAKRALVDHLWRASACSKDSIRHHPRLDQVFRILDGHLIKNLIALPRELLDHVHVGGMDQA